MIGVEKVARNDFRRSDWQSPKISLRVPDVAIFPPSIKITLSETS